MVAEDKIANPLEVYQEVLFQVLFIAEYERDKKAYAKQMVNACHEQAIQFILERLPDIEKLKLKSELAYAADKQAAIASYVSPDIYSVLLAQFFAEELERCVNIIQPTLTVKQNHTLEGYLHGLGYI